MEVPPVRHSAVRTALLPVAVLALLWAGVEFRALGRLSAPLETALAPRGLVSLELAPTTVTAAAIRDDWTCRATSRPDCLDIGVIAHRALERDTRLIAAYVLGWSLFAVWGGWAAGARRRVTAALVGCFLAGGVLDLAGNWFLGIALGNADRLPFDAVAPWIPGLADYARDWDHAFLHAVTLARLAAMSKLVILLIGVAGTIAVAGGAGQAALARRRAASGEEAEPQLAPGPHGDFETLVERENAGIFTEPTLRSKDEPLIATYTAADEPRILFRAADVIGLALSGGGIRSATFNLGLLQGLHRRRLLRLFDYLGTVSGGGYIGSFWSEWLARERERDPAAPVLNQERLFPTHRVSGSRPQDAVDTDQERHLREFSAFLAPRWGFFEVETWTAIIAMLSGLVPALLIGLSVIGVALVGWLALTFPLASRSPWAPVLVILPVTLGALYVFERMWHELKRETSGHDAARDGAGARAHARYVLVAVIACVLVGAFQWFLPRVYAWPPAVAEPLPVLYAVRSTTDGTDRLAREWQQASGESGVVRWWAIAGVARPGGSWVFSPRLFDYGLVWVAVAVVLVFVRLAHSVWPRGWTHESLASFDRVLTRVLALGVVWCGVAALWHLSINLGSLVGTVVAAALSAGLFAALRNWIGVVLRRPAEAGMLDRLKPYLPQLLAQVTIVLTAALVGGLLVALGGDDWYRWWVVTAVMVLLLVLTLFISPEAFGLHAFYRDRISRAYAGACNLSEGQSAALNRGTEPRDRDDRVMSGLVGRPLHLVCCAANDLSGDQVETLQRGARSAVLSKHGFSLGSHFHAWTPTSVPHLGSAVTASAAAFNSSMGQISVRVGPAVSFLMTLLNLRLGLWLRHPAARAAAPRRWPGLLYYREMFGLTSASGRLRSDGEPSTSLRDVHLSDGAHFENLAVYELIRRHCRYILVSDCGSDPDVAFDDLGNALRRIREDFGVEVSLDVSPLRPGADGRARQHVAVGTIHYSPTDRGILLYVKPSMTGDEPTDVLQYRTRNTAFPHESTGDQFYDEAQWESYRRLGLHAAESIFAFVSTEGDPARPVTADWVFAEARYRWGGTPDGLEARVLEMTARFGALEAELRDQPGARILQEAFPELTYSWPHSDQGRSAPGTLPQGPPASSAEAPDLVFLLRVTQLMEDAWLTCDLDRSWDHPLNLGWVNLFARWATTPTFRFWWPVLSPMFSSGFRRFLSERFPLPAGAAGPVTAQAGRVRLLDGPPEGSGLAAFWWASRSAQPREWATYTRPTGSRALYENVLDLHKPEGALVEMQVGMAAVTQRGEYVGWTSDDFFVPPSLWGAGIGWHFLKGLLAHVAAGSAKRCYAVVKRPPPDARHEVALADRRSFVEQYRKIGFRERGAPDARHHDPAEGDLCRALGLDDTQDTLLVLDLVQWSSRGGT